MSKPTVTIEARALLDRALRKMITKGLRHLAVVDEDGRCLGMLSDRTIAAAWATDYEALSRQTVMTALDLEPAVLSEHCAVVDAARIMRRTGTDAVAVIDGDRRPIGVITGSNLVSLLAR
jgi:CBS domain-containing protein